MKAWSLVVMAALAGSVVAMDAQSPVFSSRVEAVRVDVLVTDRDNRPILGLTADDFEIFDNGIAQQVELVSFDQIPLNVILALDLSDSVAGDRFERLRTASRGLLAALQPDDQAGLISFRNRVKLGSPLTKDAAALQEALEPAAADGETAVIDATYAGIMLGESDVGRGLMIVFSDGSDTVSWLTPDRVLDTARRSDIVVYAVSTRIRNRPDFLGDVANLTGGRLYEVERTTNLAQTFLNVLEEFRRRYLVSYTPRGVERAGWHRLDVRVKNRRVNVKSRPGYLSGS